MEKIGQLFFWKRVLLDVTHTVELAVPTASASNIRTKRTPHHNVRLPEYREPSLLLILLDERRLLLAQLCEADLSVECQCSCAIEQQHDGQSGEGEDVVINSEALMNADGDERGQHIDRNQSCGEASEKTND